MKSRLVCFVASVLLFSALSVWAADVAGKWVAQVQGRNGQTRETTFVFKVDGEKLTGTVSAGRRENPITDGKVTGDEISFSTMATAQGSEVKVNFKGKVSGDEIKFTRTREGAGGQGQELTAKRAK